MQAAESSPVENPLPLPWLAVFLLGASALSYEILLIRLFSVLHWHHFAYMAIGLALLGHGVSGAFLAFTQQRLLQHFSLAFELNTVLFAVTAPTSYFISQAIPFNTQEIIWGAEHWWRLLLIESVLILPFFFAANVIGLAVCYFKTRISLVYSADLVGSGIGAIGIIGLLYLLSLKALLLAIPLMALLSAISVQWLWKKWIDFAISITILLITALTYSLWPAIKVADYKGLNKVLQLPKTSIIHESSSPLGLINIVSSPAIPLRFASGISLNYQGDIPEQLGLFIDGESAGGITRYDGSPEPLHFLTQTTSALAYEVVKTEPAVLLVGLGDGTEVLQATLYSPALVDIIEPNQQLITLFTHSVASFWGWQHLSPISQIHHSDLRGGFNDKRHQYDLVKIHAIEGSNASLLSLRERYPLTTEAFQRYWQALSAGGVLSITVWQDLPPKAALRVVNTMLSMLSEQGVTDANAHIAVIRSWQTVTLLLGRSPFNQSQINKIKSFNRLNHFDPVYYYGITPGEVNRYNQLQAPYYYNGIQALLQGDELRKTFLSQYPFDVAATSDNTPYFYHFFKIDNIAELATLWRAGGEAMIPQGYLVLWFTLSQALLLSVVLIMLPLHWLKRKSATDSHQQNTGLFFVTLGLAFLMVEWVMVERFILFLSHPSTTGASVIGTFLVFAGFGSAYSQHRVIHNQASIALVACTIFGLCVVYHFLLPRLFDTFATVSLPVKIAISFITLAPLAFLMGMPFPLSLAMLAKNRGEVYLPWAWGVNGCASVVSVSLATLIAVNYGFSVTLLLAALLYLLAAVLSRSFKMSSAER